MLWNVDVWMFLLFISGGINSFLLIILLLLLVNANLLSLKNPNLIVYYILNILGYFSSNFFDTSIIPFLGTYFIIIFRKSSIVILLIGW